MERGKVLVRLNRYLSLSGVTSRRKADQLILEGRVKVNGITVRELGWRIDPKRDYVEVDGKPVKPQRFKYIALYKPYLYLTSLGAPKEGKRTIQELIKDIPERLYPTGRLDYNAEGLLILTNDGELANRIMHPRYKLPKTYEALVRGRVEKKTLEAMEKGAQLEDGFVKPVSVRIIKHEGENTLLELVFTEGRKHIVKRFTAHFGHRVLKLKRTAIGPIKLGKLKPGKWRELSQEEVTALRKAVKISF